MASMYPDRLRIDTESMAERRLYKLFRAEVPDDYVVFHSVSWLARDTRGGAQDGEADFIVAHPDRGILVIEVKGGNIRYDGVAGQWYSHSYAIKDPFEQARRNKFSLLEKLKDLPYWRQRWLTLGHAVAFPDVVVKHDLRLDAPVDIILDAEDLASLTAWVERVMDYWRDQDHQDGRPGSTGLQELIDLLSPSWELRAPLALEFAEEAEKIIRLTEEQFALLDFLNGRRRVAIAGCAGSGKTTMALEQSRRLARQGFRVLFTCFNKALAEYIRSDEELPDNIEASHFHGLCVRKVHQAGLSDRLKGGWSSQTWYDQKLPELLVEAAEVLGPQYDAVVIDEGQDFQSNWWLSLLYLLEDPDRGIFYVFYDDNQNLYQEALQLPEELEHFALHRNCRNTQHIHNTFLPFYQAATAPTAIGPRGRAPELIYYDSDSGLNRAMRRVLHRLVNEEQVYNEDVVILTPRARENSLLWQWGYLGNFRVTDRWPPDSGEVYCTTVHSFKGLESPVVILAEVYPSARQNLETLLYVGCSRARNHLIILADENLPSEIQSRLSHR